MIRFISICLFIVIKVCLANGQVVLSGHVYNQENKTEQLIGANIFVKGIKKGVASNEEGFYSLSLPIDKTLFVQVSYIGFESQRIKLKLNRDSTLNIYLMLKKDLPTIEVKAEKSKPIAKDIGIISTPVSKLLSIPAIIGELDVMKAIALMPGISNGAEGTSGLLIRGGTPDQNLILLNDATIFSPSHLFGFISVFQAETISNIQVFKSGFPAEYGNRLSGIVNITSEQKLPLTKETKLRIGLLSSSFFKQGNMNQKTSFAFGGRASYFDILTLPSFIQYQKKGKDQFINYRMYDLNARLAHQLNEHDYLDFNLYHGNDFYIIKEKASKQLENNLDPHWGNTAFSLTYRKVFNTSLLGKLSVSRSSYNYNIALASNKNKADESSIQNKSSVAESNLSYKMSHYVSGNYKLLYGLDINSYTFKIGEIKELSAGQVATKERDQLMAQSISAFVDNSIQLKAGFDFKLGFRFFNYHYNGEWKHFVEPRMRLLKTWDKDQSAIEINATIMNQALHLLAGNGNNFPKDIWIPSSKNIPIQQSKQVGLAYSQKFKKEKWQLNIEVFYKNMNHLTEYTPSTQSFFFTDSNNYESQIETGGKGQAYGFEIFLKKNKGTWTGWLAYTFSRSIRSFPTINSGNNYFAKYDRPHDFEAVFSRQLNKKWQFNSTIVLSSGFVVTIPVTVSPTGEAIYSNINNARAPFYFRTDIGFTKKIKTKRNHQGEWTFSVYNATAKANPFYINYFYFLDDSNNVNAFLEQVNPFRFIPSISYQITY